MEYEIILGQVIADVYKEKQLILQNSILEDLGYKKFKEGEKIICFLEVRQKFTASLKNCSNEARDKLFSSKLAI